MRIMELTIKKTTVIREVEAVTVNATYKVTCTAVESQLQNVTARVFETREIDAPGPNGPVKQPQLYEVGTLVMENSMMRSGQFPYTEKLPLYMSDFIGIVNEIVEPAQPCV